MMLLRPERLKGVHDQLCRIILDAVPSLPFDVQLIQGVRTIAEHQANLASGASRAKYSRHVPEFNACKMSCAVDMAPLVSVNGKREIAWQHFDKFKLMDVALTKSAAKLGLFIEWGHNFKGFKDTNHWQLPLRQYPRARGVA
jgi:hypothetical protein